VGKSRTNTNLFNFKADSINQTLVSGKGTFDRFSFGAAYATTPNEAFFHIQPPAFRTGADESTAILKVDTSGDLILDGTVPILAGAWFSPPTKTGTPTLGATVYISNATSGTTGSALYVAAGDSIFKGGTILDGQVECNASFTFGNTNDMSWGAASDWSMVFDGSDLTLTSFTDGSTFTIIAEPTGAPTAYNAIRIDPDTSSGLLDLTANGLVQATGVQVDGDLDHQGTQFALGGGTLGAAQSGWSPTNVDTTPRSYDANATSIDQLADALGTLIADLKTKGIIAA
jgi:hypothetical protein